jgi:hypothetical protein
VPGDTAHRPASQRAAMVFMTRASKLDKIPALVQRKARETFGIRSWDWNKNPSTLLTSTLERRRCLSLVL